MSHSPREIGDPEFGTHNNAARLHAALDKIGHLIDDRIGPERDVLDVLDGPRGPTHNVRLTERQIRLIRFALRRANETI